MPSSNSSWVWVVVGALLLNLVLSPSTGSQKVSTVESEEQRVKVKERVRVVVQPDGTKEVEKTTVTTLDHSRKLESTPAVAKSKYRIGVDYLPSFDRPPRSTDIILRTAARLGTSPAWLELGVDLKHHQVTIGISVEF